MSHYLAPPPPYRRSTRPTPPSALAAKPVAVAALQRIQQLGSQYGGWRAPDPDSDHTESLAVWLRVADELRQLRDLLNRLDPPPTKGGNG